MHVCEKYMTEGPQESAHSDASTRETLLYLGGPVMRPNELLSEACFTLNTSWIGALSKKTDAEALRPPKIHWLCMEAMRDASSVKQSCGEAICRPVAQNFHNASIIRKISPVT